METLENANQNILIIQTAFLGDAILTLPLIQRLGNKFSGSIIDVISIPTTSEIFRASPYVNKVYTLDKRGSHKSLTGMYSFVKEIRKNNYSKVYSPHRSFRSGLITLLIQANNSYGFDNSSFKYAYKTLVHYNLNDHEVKRNLSLTGDKIDGNGWKIIPEIIIDEYKITEIENYLKENNLADGFIAVAPGSVWETKRYPAEYYSELIDALSETGNKIVMIGSKNDRGLCEKIASNCIVEPHITAGAFDIVGTVELLKHSDLLITNDSAPTHMGMTADIPVLTLYCSTVAGFGFYPYNEKSAYLSYDNLDCKPCGIHGFHHCPAGSFDCGYELTPSEVLKKAKQMLQSNG